MDPLSAHGLDLSDVSSTAVALPPAVKGFRLEGPQLLRELDWAAQSQYLRDLKKPTAILRIDWVGATYYAGLADYARSLDLPWANQALRTMTSTFNHGHIYRPSDPTNADDDAIGQAYLELYRRSGDPLDLVVTKARMDVVLAYLEKKAQAPSNLLWWWCDSLFMSPPVLAQLAQITGDTRYLRALDAQWWQVADFLYDTSDHLFYRDERFLNRRTPAGNKVYWSRGNGWVIGGLVRILREMPLTYPSRSRYVQMFQEMAAAVATHQGSDGLWRSSLMDDPQSASPESSGTAFFVYAWAWGINNKLLNPEIYRPKLLKAWAGLRLLLRRDGLPGYVQPIGDQPAPFRPENTMPYATGAYLMAGLELQNLLPLELPDVELINPLPPTDPEVLRNLPEPPRYDYCQ